ncbi:MAG: sterol desaturase family protein [Paraburkholderia sp.]|nr:MAG: sterol desaturase family protein [Paraburkholderia sp.]
MHVIYPGIGIVAIAVVLFLLERRFALRRQRHALLRRLAVNVVVTAAGLATAFALVKPAATLTMQHVESARFGLLQWLGLPPVIAFLGALLLLDFTFYLWHYANHRVPLLWRFHVVHHIDPDLDVFTAFRFHFGEVALSAVFRVVQIALIGAPPPAVMVYEFLFQANTLFQHSNVRLPIRVERALNWILVTPRMHGIHHSMVRQENTSNFSVVFSIWDRLRRTATLNVPQQEIVIGIPAYEKHSDNAAATLLALPFRHQPDAWRRADGSTVTRERARSDMPVRRLAA